MIRQNLSCVKDKISEAAKKAGRSPQDIILVCVTKTATVEGLRQGIGCGITDIGENRLQEAVSKKAAVGELANALRWHMIGHLQTNKVKKALEVFDLIHSLDSMALAHEIDKRAGSLNKRIDCLVEVKTSAEPGKFGVRPQDLIDFIKEVASLRYIRIIGLMTMAPFSEDPEQARPFFARLRQLRQDLISERIPNTDIRELSMGMSQDYQVAIEEGATLVRIGTAIFGG